MLWNLSLQMVLHGEGSILQISFEEPSLNTTSRRWFLLGYMSADLNLDAHFVERKSVDSQHSPSGLMIGTILLQGANHDLHGLVVQGKMIRPEKKNTSCQPRPPAALNVTSTFSKAFSICCSVLGSIFWVLRSQPPALCQLYDGVERCVECLPWPPHSMTGPTRKAWLYQSSFFAFSP